MSLHTLGKAARLHLRAELLIAQIRLRTEARKGLLTAFAGLLALMALAFINLAAYRALESVWGPVWTPLALGLADAILAVLLFALASFARPGADLAAAEELRALTGTALESELQAGLPGAGLVGLLAGGDGSAARLLVSTLGLIAGALKRRKSAPP